MWGSPAATGAPPRWRGIRGGIPCRSRSAWRPPAMRGRSRVTERLAALLALPMPDAPWHSHRDRLAEIAAAPALLAGTCGKIARDVTLLMQTEIAEAFEPAAPGRSMPHLRSPTAASAALACATMAPQLAATIMPAESPDQEGATGAWQVECPAFPSLLLVVSGALAGVVAIGEGLEIDNERMRLNLDATRGPILAGAGPGRAARE